MTKRAARDLRKLDPPIQRRILAALDGIITDPHAAPLVRLTGRPESRLRVGDWRVLVELDDHAREIFIHHIGPRGRVYRD